MINNLSNNIAKASTSNAQTKVIKYQPTDSDTKNISSIFEKIFGTSNGIKGVTKPEGLPQDQDPDSYAQQYADENDISLDEAKAELEEKFGAPENPNQDFTAKA